MALEKTFAHISLTARERLSRQYPSGYVNRHFEGPKSFEHGAEHGLKVFTIGLKICERANIRLTNEQIETFAFIALMHDFADAENTEANRIFTRRLRAPAAMSHGLTPELSAEIERQYAEFEKLLPTGKSVRQFHNYSGACVATDIAQKLKWCDERVETVCQSILFHNTRGLYLLRQIPKGSRQLAHLLYSADKLASTGADGMARFPQINIVRFGRLFYDEGIPIEHRFALLEDLALTPEKQRETELGTRFDCLHFMLIHLFKDSLDPETYPNPLLVASYLQDEDIFSDSLKAYLEFAKEYHGTNHSKGDAFAGMKELLLFALASEKYKQFVDQIRSGIAQVDLAYRE